VNGGGVLDSHHHLWDTNELHYRLFDEVTELRRPYRLADYDADAAPLGVTRSICVEAASAGAEGRRETEWLIRHLEGRTTVVGLVAWAPLDDAEFDRYLDWLASLPGTRVVGVRRSFEFDPPDFPRKPAVASGAHAAGERGLVVDLVLFPPSLPAAIDLVDRCPDTQFVLDHLGKPSIGTRQLEPWAGEIRELALRPNVSCKLSALPTEADRRHWTTADLRPYADHALACFGYERLLYGSDWPVVNLAGGLGRWFGAVCELLSGLTEDQRHAVLSRNASQIYHVA
jgi:L-fuconolactonase